MATAGSFFTSHSHLVARAPPRTSTSSSGRPAPAGHGALRGLRVHGNLESPDDLRKEVRVPRRNAVAGTVATMQLLEQLAAKPKPGLAAAAKSAPYTEDTSKPKLGFVGMGIMGVPMTQRLLAAGYEVVVWNRTSSKCEPVVKAGAKSVSTAKEVAERADITFAMLADPDAALDVVLGNDGVAAGMSSGKGYVDVSTVDSATSNQIAAAVRATGASFLEAPVSGSKKPAEDGMLIFLTAGDEALFRHSEPMLDVMGKAHFFLGEVGKGAEMKLVVNMIMGSMMAAFAEGLQLGKESGLSQDKIIEVISLGAIASPMFALKGPSMIQGNFSTAFPLKHQQKDMRLALSLGDEKAQELPVAAAANELFKRARSEGHDGVGAGTRPMPGDEDFSAVLKALENT